MTEEPGSLSWARMISRDWDSHPLQVDLVETSGDVFEAIMWLPVFVESESWAGPGYAAESHGVVWHGIPFLVVGARRSWLYFRVLYKTPSVISSLEKTELCSVKRLGLTGGGELTLPWISLMERVDSVSLEVTGWLTGGCELPRRTQPVGAA